MKYFAAGVFAGLLVTEKETALKLLDLYSIELRPGRNRVSIQQIFALYTLNNLFSFYPLTLPNPCSLHTIFTSLYPTVPLSLMIIHASIYTSRITVLNNILYIQFLQNAKSNLNFQESYFALTVS
jgi:hypothetical protein